MKIWPNLKVKQHTEEEKKKILKVLDLITKAKDLCSKYYWFMVEEMNIDDQHLTRYDEIHETVMKFFIEGGVGYRELYDTIEPNFRFSQEGTVWGRCFLMDSVAGVVLTEKMTIEEKYNFFLRLAHIIERYNEFSELALKLKNDNFTGVKVEEFMKTTDGLLTESKKAEIIEQELIKNNIDNIDTIMGIIRKTLLKD